MRRTYRALLFALGLGLAAPAARAESTTSSKAAAEALFQQGAELVQAGNFALACEKFGASHKLDPALGTMLRWADCLDRTGKSASSWALFQEAAGIAHARGETDRERIAEQRAGYLKDNLALLELRSAPRAEKDLVVRVNGAVIPRESLDTPLPVDPGNTTVELSAPGYRTWSTRLTIKAGPSKQELVLPKLVPAPQAKASLKPAPKRTTVEPSGVHRTAGWITAGVGVLGLAGGALFGLRASELASQSKAHCREDDANACDQTGYALRKDALTFADAATLSGGIGGGLVLIGIGLVVFAPSRESEVRAAALPGGASLELGGRF